MVKEWEILHELKRISKLCDEVNPALNPSANTQQQQQLLLMQQQQQMKQQGFVVFAVFCVVLNLCRNFQVVQ
jgi:hypothetical protein